MYQNKSLDMSQILGRDSSVVLRFGCADSGHFGASSRRKTAVVVAASRRRWSLSACASIGSREMIFPLVSSDARGGVLVARPRDERRTDRPARHPD
jgi:hypothetical protein